jgi:hypothetical protein
MSNFCHFYKKYTRRNVKNPPAGMQADEGVERNGLFSSAGFLAFRLGFDQALI